MSKEYLIKDISVVRKKPINKEFNQNDRKRAAFLYVIKGDYQFTTEKGEFSAKENDVVYLPKNSAYSYVIESTSAEGIMVDFGFSNEKNFLISKVPLALPAGTQTADMFNELLSCFYRDEQFLILSELFKIIAMFESGISKKDGLGKIRPAVEFIESNFVKPISVKELATLCGISESHFRRLFREKMKMSAVKYKNSVIIKHACALLKSDDMNITEVSESLNFCSIYAFSRMFKKEMGMSPKKYLSLQ